MKRLCCIWMLAGILLATHAVQAAAPPKNLLLAYYYPWYQAGDWSRHEYNNSPTLGTYGTDDPATAERHVDWAADHHIHGFFVSWWGFDSLTDRHLKAGLLQARNMQRIRFAIYYEAFGVLDPRDGKRDSLVDFSHPAVLQKMIADFAHLQNDFFGHPQYLKIDGKPLVGLYVTRQFRNFDATHIAALEKALGVDLYLTADEPFYGRQRTPATAFNSSGFDAFHAYNMFENANVREGEPASEFLSREALPVYQAWAAEKVFMPGLMPAYHDFRGNKVLMGSPSDFQKSVDLLKSISGKPVSRKIEKVFLLTSFNEWWEGTTVEPAKEYGMGYLEVLKSSFEPWDE